MDMPKHEKRAILRQQLWRTMHDNRGRLGKVIGFILIFLILVSVAIVPLEFLPASQNFKDILTGIEIFIVAVFTVDYLLLVYAAPRRLHYIFSFFGIIDLLSILPFYTGLFHTEYIRVFRLIRLLKLSEAQPGASTDEEQDMHRDMGLIEGEQVEYVVTKHPLFLVVSAFPTIIALCFSMGLFLLADGNPVGIAGGLTIGFFALILLYKAWLDFSYDVIYLTNYRLIFHNQHLLGRSINQVNYSSITNVKPSFPTALSYIFRYGSLVIDTAAEHPGQISIGMIRKQEEAAQMIMQKSFSQSQSRSFANDVTQRASLSGGKYNSGSTTTPSL